MKQKLLLSLLIFSWICMGQVIVVHGEDENIRGEILQDISLDEIESYWDELEGDYGEYLTEIEKKSIYDVLKSDEPFSLQNFFQGIVNYFFHEIIQSGSLLGSLLLLTLFSMLLQIMHTAFENSTVSKIAYFVVFLVLIFIALNSFYTVISYAKETIDMMSGFMISLIPLILGLMATFGNVLAVSFFHPIIIFLIHFIGVFVSVFVLPLLSFAVLLSIISSISENYKVTNLANLIRTIALSSLGVLLSIFLGVMSVQGAASAIQDGVTLKTAKFITGNFIPVVGRTFTDAVDTILSASLLLKNSIGIVGLIIILFICLFPAIKILIIAFIYKLAAAVLQPIGDGPIISVLQTISTFILYIFACLLAVSFMFLLAIVLIVAASNLTLLLR